MVDRTGPGIGTITSHNQGDRKSERLEWRSTPLSKIHLQQPQWLRKTYSTIDMNILSTGACKVRVLV